MENIKNELEEAFTKIYDKNIWLRKKSKSGSGSDDEETKYVKKELIEFIKTNNIKSILDIGCGDFNWMKKIIEKTNIKYLGVDFVKPLIEDNNKKYASNNIKFEFLNYNHNNFPDAELIICRDVLVHLSFKNIFNFFEKLKITNFKYIFITNFIKKERENLDGEVTNQLIWWMPLNLYKTPFNLPESKFIINEKLKHIEFNDKSLCLWEKSDIKKINNIK